MSTRLCLMGLALALAACGASDDEASGAQGDEDPNLDAGAGGPGGEPCADEGECPSGYACFDGICVFQGVDPSPEPEPEPVDPEEEALVQPRLQPAAGRTRVWVVAPETDRVARIDAEALTVEVVEVGDRPTAVGVRAGTDTAVVLCRGSDELMVIGPEDDAPRVHRLPGHFNALALGPAGRFAYAWFDLADAGPGEDASAVQDVAVLDLETGRQHPVTIGFAPRAVHFAEDGAALFITDDGVSVIAPERLDGPTVARAVPVAPDVFSQAEREVALTADGRFAVSRGPGEQGITVVALDEGVPRFVDLGAEPTDLDLLPDGTALVMLREAHRLALVPLADPAARRFVDFPGRALGSAAVSPLGDRAVLYATRRDRPPAAALLALPEGRLIDIALRKRARVGLVDPTGAVAWVLHGPEPVTASAAQMGEGMGSDDMGPEDMDPDDMGPGDMGPDDMGPEDAMPADDMDPGDAMPADAMPDALPPPPPPVVDAELADRHGYSLVDLRTGFVKLQITDSAPYAIAFGPGAAFIALPGAPGVQPSLQRADLALFSTRGWPLGSAPEALGVLPAVGRAFVTQAHPTGRISFVPLDADGRITTLTGYALDGRIQ